jgi:hypothetical protein
MAKQAHTVLKALERTKKASKFKIGIKIQNCLLSPGCC